MSARFSLTGISPAQFLAAKLAIIKAGGKVTVTATDETSGEVGVVSGRKLFVDWEFGYFYSLASSKAEIAVIKGPIEHVESYLRDELAKVQGGAV